MYSAELNAQLSSAGIELCELVNALWDEVVVLESSAAPPSSSFSCISSPITKVTLLRTNCLV